MRQLRRRMRRGVFRRRLCRDRRRTANNKLRLLRRPEGVGFRSLDRSVGRCSGADVVGGSKIEVASTYPTAASQSTTTDVRLERPTTTIPLPTASSSSLGLPCFSSTSVLHLRLNDDAPRLAATAATKTIYRTGPARVTDMAPLGRLTEQGNREATDPSQWYPPPPFERRHYHLTYGFCRWRT